MISKPPVQCALNYAYMYTPSIEFPPQQHATYFPADFLIDVSRFCVGFSPAAFFDAAVIFISVNGRKWVSHQTEVLAPSTIVRYLW